jgi:hypothetical protein
MDPHNCPDCGTPMRLVHEEEGVSFGDLPFTLRVVMALTFCFLTVLAFFGLLAFAGH